MLSAFLDDMARRPFADGTADCILMPADWVVLKGHPDPAAPYRGTYSTPEERKRVIREAFGIRALVAGGAIRAGLAWAAEPQREDVGLIRFGGRLVGAICLGARWAMKGEGIVVGPADDVLMAWRV